MEEGVQGLIIGICFGLVIGIISMTYIVENYKNKEIAQLGESICEEEYGMDYESYYKEILRCKPFTESYDGIKVEVPKTTKESNK